MILALRRVAPTIRLVIVFALFASGCGLTGGAETLAAPTVGPSVELLPAPVPDSSNGADAEPSDAVPSVAASPAEVEAVATPLSTQLSCFSQRQRIAQLLLPLVTQADLATARVFAADGELGGIAFLGQPDAAVADELAALQQASLLAHVLVASDEEGGTVQRFATLLGPMPSASTTAQSRTPEDARSEWFAYGTRLAQLGVDVVFGPVLDVGSGPGIGTRSFSEDPAIVATFGRAVAEGLVDAGITPVFKHFPGHGRATADSHLELPTTPPLDELRAVDLVPYVELLADPILRDRAGVMVGHLAVPGLSGEVPTSMSPESVTGLLRDELGFPGLIFTDAMNMGAIVNTYGLLEAIELAIRAGADIAILGSLADLTPALDHLVARAAADPELASILDDRVARVLTAKGQESLCAGAQ